MRFISSGIRPSPVSSSYGRKLPSQAELTVLYLALSFLKTKEVLQWLIKTV